MTLLERNADVIRGLANEARVEARSITALLLVEAGGEGLVNGRPIVRLEVHHLWLGVRPAVRPRVDARFRMLGPRPWEGHEFLRQPPSTGTWYPLHQHGHQGLEWEALDVARAIDDTAAIEATSWGCGQVLGRHWARLGFAGPGAFVGTQGTEAGQIETVMRFLSTVAGALEDLREHRWAEVARKYNGAGQVEWYSSRLAAAYLRAA